MSDNHRFAEQCADHYLKTRDRPALDAYVQSVVHTPKQQQTVFHLIDQYIAKKAKPAKTAKPTKTAKPAKTSKPAEPAEPAVPAARKKPAAPPPKKRAHAPSAEPAPTKQRSTSTVSVAQPKPAPSAPSQSFDPILSCDDTIAAADYDDDGDDDDDDADDVDNVDAKEDVWGFYDVAQTEEGDDDDDEIDLPDGAPTAEELAENDEDDDAADEDAGGVFDPAQYKTASGAIDFKAAEKAFKVWKAANAGKNVSLQRFMAMVNWVEDDDAEEMPEDVFQRSRYNGTRMLIEKDQRRIAEIDEALADPETSKKDIKRLEQMREHALNTIEERKEELARLVKKHRC